MSNTPGVELGVSQEGDWGVPGQAERRHVPPNGKPHF